MLHKKPRAPIVLCVSSKLEGFRRTTEERLRRRFRLSIIRLHFPWSSTLLLLLHVALLLMSSFPAQDTLRLRQIMASQQAFTSQQFTAAAGGSNDSTEPPHPNCTSTPAFSTLRVLCSKCARPWQSTRYKTCDRCRQPATRRTTPSYKVLGVDRNLICYHF